ncbi:MAG: hypothetical protein ACFE9L_10945 [Candidatus Hodarchaeota archaeon]
MAKIDYNFILLLVVLTKIVSMGGGITDDGLSDITEQLWKVHKGISIDGNEDFKTTAQSEGWPSSGSLTNPYLIEGLSYSAFLIWNTDVHFQVTNCHLTDSINFLNASNVIISNSTISCTGWGIDITNCVNITFVKNEIRNHGEGI